MRLDAAGPGSARARRPGRAARDPRDAAAASGDRSDRAGVGRRPRARAGDRAPTITWSNRSRSRSCLPGSRRCCGGAPKRPPAVRRLAFDGGQADLERHEVTFDDGERCELSDREWQLLHYLAYNAGRAVSRDELLARVWGLNPAGITTGRSTCTSRGCARSFATTREARESC